MTRQYVTSPYAETAQQPRVGHPPRMSTLTPRLVLGSAAGTTLLLVSAGVIATVEEGALRDWWASDSFGTNGTIDLLNVLGSLTALTNIVAFVATGLWLLELRRVAEWASPTTHQRRSGYWAFLGWIVPVVCLWFPYQLVADASRGVGSRVRTLWPWWLAWLLLAGFTFRGGSGGALESEPHLARWIRDQQYLAIIAVVAFVLWWRVVRSASTAAASAVDGVRVTS